MKESISQQRKIASDLSLGLSHKVIYDKALTLINKLASQGAFLDFGAGQGKFVSYVHEKCHMSQYSAVDLMERPEDIPSEINWIQSDLNDRVDVIDNSIQIVSALEVIEHLENPRHVFRELYRIIEPGGHLILSTPNVESWRSILSFIKRGHFVAFTDRSYPAHITPLNRKDLYRAARESGFKLVDWSFTNQGCVPGVTSLTWQSISLGLLRGLRYSDNIFIILKK